MEDINGYFEHKKTLGKYAAIGSCRIKIKEKWVDGVVYMQHQNIFVRDRKDFLESFQRVTEYPTN
jgi:hypothetical protein